jgi:hypothetical protein
VLSARALIRCPCPVSVRTWVAQDLSPPAPTLHTIMVRSRDAVYRCPSPPHLTLSMLSLWPLTLNWTAPVRTFHTRTVPSWLAEARRAHPPPEATSVARWSGSHASDVTHDLCPLRGLQCGLPVAASHTRTSPALSADAKRRPSGDQAVQRTWWACPLTADRGVHEPTSQKRTMASPPPEARTEPSGEKETWRTASVCPGRLSVQRVTGRTLKTERGWYRMRAVASVVTCARSRADRSVPTTSSSFT